MPRWNGASPRWPWRDCLTDDEREIIEAGDRAKAEWERLNATRAGIVNRAIQRAKYRATNGDIP